MDVSQYGERLPFRRGRLQQTVYRSKQNQAVKVRIVHEPEAVDMLLDAISEMGTSLVVELGTQFGGLTLAIHESSQGIEVHSFDNNNVVGEQTAALLGSQVHLYVEDVLVPNSKVEELLQRADFKLLYCDNGRKRTEVNLYAPFLQSGDVLGVHDWARDREVWWSDVADIIGDFEPLWHEQAEELGILMRLWIKK